MIIVARIAAGAICAVLSNTATAMPPIAATPLTKPDTSPVASRTVRVGASARWKPLRSSTAASNNSAPINRRNGVSGTNASTRMPSGMNSALPNASQLSQGQSASFNAPRNRLMLASTSSMKIGGTTWAGVANSDRPATHSAEKPKPEKPRTMPAANTTSRLATISGQGRGGNSGMVCWRGAASPQPAVSNSLRRCTLPDGPRGSSPRKRNTLGVL